MFTCERIRSLENIKKFVALPRICQRGKQRPVIHSERALWTGQIAGLQPAGSYA